jgi:predicted DNA-binding protein with PD1-like motif
MTVTTSSARHLLVRFADPARLPAAIHAALRDEVVLAGWMRASGVVSEVELRVGASGVARRLEGTFHLIALEGSVGLAAGDVSCGMRAVLARETDAGIVALEVLITAFDELTGARQLDPAGAWLLEATDGTPRPAPEARDLPTARTAPAPAPVPTEPEPVVPTRAHEGFGDAVRVAELARSEPARPAPAPNASPKPSPTFSSPLNQAMPQRIARPAQAETEDDPVPEPGDVVEHFAFGRCEVVKTDGDRLHLRLGKDQRIKEIALEMLKVTSLPQEDGQVARHWKLARKL